MAIKIKSATMVVDTITVLTAFVLQHKWLTPCLKYGLDLSFGANKVIISSTTSGKTFAVVSASSGALKLAMDGALGAGSLEYLAHLLENEVEKIVKAISAMMADVDDFDPTHPQWTTALKDAHYNMPVIMTLPSKGSQPPPTTFKSSAEKKSAANLSNSPTYAPTPTTEAIAMEVINGLFASANDASVKLSVATKLYQPVTGTSAGSRYFVVAIGDDIKVAARVKGNQVSIRCEGDVHGKWASLLDANGFTVSQDYASMHIEAPTMLMMKRTLGAVLLGLGLILATPLPDLELIKNKGN